VPAELPDKVNGRTQDKVVFALQLNGAATAQVDPFQLYPPLQEYWHLVPVSIDQYVYGVFSKRFTLSLVNMVALAGTVPVQE